MSFGQGTRHIASLAVALSIVPISAPANILYTSQDRSIAARASWWNTSAAAPDFGEFDEFVEMSDPLGNWAHGSAWQRSTLSSTRIDAAGGCDANGGFHASTGEGTNTFDVTFTIADPTTFSLTGFDGIYASYGAVVTVDFTGPGGNVFTSRVNWENPTDLFDVSGTLLPGDYRLRVFAQAGGSLTEGSGEVSFGLTLLVPSIPSSACGQWLPTNAPSAVEGTVFAMATWDPDGDGPLAPLLIAGGEFTAAGDTSVGNIAAWDPKMQAWSPLGSGTDGAVRTLLVIPGGDLIAGGDFTTAGGVSANHVARWNGMQWSPLGAGIDGSVKALAVLPGGDLVAGGNFLPGNVARWNGTTWSAMAEGLSGGGVYALEVMSGGDLVAGGDFYFIIDDSACTGVARWNGTEWLYMGGGVDTAVFALTTLPNGDLVEGDLDGRVLRWTGSGWASFGQRSHYGMVFAMHVMPNGDLITSGGFDWFQPCCDEPWKYPVSRWDGHAWTWVGSMNDEVYALAALPDGQVVTGGRFTYAEGVKAGHVARSNGAVWTDLTSDRGMDSDVLALAPLSDGRIVAGGEFTTVAGVSASRIAIWDGVSAQALGPGLNGQVNAVAILPNGDIVAGGGFSAAGEVAANRIARWNGASWSPLGNGVSGGGWVSSLAVMPDGGLVAAGGFTDIGGIAANRIARWNGTSWTPLGAGVDDYMSALAVMPNGDLVAGGFFTTAGGVAVNYIARWNGTEWSPLGTGMNYAVRTLAVMPNGDLIAGGGFTTAGGVDALRIARWNGTSWSSLGDGIGPGVSEHSVLALAVAPTGELVAGGNFNFADRVLSRFIALWNGQEWRSLGTGTNNIVSALATLPDGRLVAGGSFTIAGASNASRIARYDFGAPPSIFRQPQPATACRGDTEIFSIAASGPGAISYLWQVEQAPSGSGAWTDLYDGLFPEYIGSAALAHGTSTDTLTISNADFAAALRYRAVVGNRCAAAATDPAPLILCTGDFNCDGSADGADVQAFFTYWEAGAIESDVNDDGGIDGADVEFFFTHWEGGC